MAETLSLAANILQVLDYSKKFAVTAWAFYQSGSEGVEYVLTLQSVSGDFKAVLVALQNGHQAPDSNAVAGDDGIASLAGRCAVDLDKMLKTLDKLGVDKGKKLNAAKAAFKLMWKQGDIEALRVRLDQYRDELTLYLVSSLRSTVSLSLEKQDEILSELRIVKGHLQENRGVHGTQNSLDDGFGSIAIDYLTHGLEDPDNTKAHLLRALVDAIHGRSKPLEDSWAASEIHLSKSRKQMLQQKFIARLRYPNMEGREYGIDPAHEATYRWAFEDGESGSTPSHSLKGWLQTNGRLYWITGKAGSGKSTLMRYMSEPVLDSNGPGGKQRRCGQYLRKWGDTTSPLIIATFYFWAAGASEMHTSFSGLFRTLLYQLLTVCPGSVPIASPARWEALSLFNEDPKDFTEGELRNILYRAVEHLSTDFRVVLFVDGLDEFNGELKLLIDLFHTLSSKFAIKVCLSSRPWVQFEDAFRTKPQLKVEDLTQSDITAYVTAKFRENTYFSELQLRQPGNANTLITSIVSKASGVFLWVKLAVSSLLAGLNYGDRMEDLERRLDLLPKSWKSSTTGC